MKGLASLLKNPLILYSLCAVAVIGVASGAYYVAATRSPQNIPALSGAAASSNVIIASGVVEPAENPNLAFESGGRVVSVNVAVRQKVAQSQILASLDTASLQAQRAQALAALAAQQANLDQMNAGPRQVDVQAKQTAVAQANAALSNVYASLPATLEEAYDESFSGVSAGTDTLFNQPNSPDATLVFSTTDNQDIQNAADTRTAAEAQLALWQPETAALSADSSTAQIDTALSNSIAHLQIIRAYADTLLQALGDAIPSGNFSQASTAAAQASVGGLRDTVNGLILSLQGEQQAITTDTLAVESAGDALSQTLASSTPEQIEAQQAQVEAAQANVANFNAQISNSIVSAPFAGTVASVQVKVGDIVAPDTTAVSLNPLGALQMTVYLSEIDSARISVGEAADVTLDAYGTGRHFSATVATIDSSPSNAGDGTTGYKVTLQFLRADSAISSGMTANVSIIATTTSQ